MFFLVTHNISLVLWKAYRNGLHVNKRNSRDLPDARIFLSSCKQKESIILNLTLVHLNQTKWLKWDKEIASLQVWPWNCWFTKVQSVMLKVVGNLPTMTSLQLRFFYQRHAVFLNLHYVTETWCQSIRMKVCVCPREAKQLEKYERLLIVTSPRVGEFARTAESGSAWNSMIGLTCCPCGEGGYSWEFLGGGGVPLGSSDPDPISDQKM